ncbi:MAG: hypothetical protein Q4D79_11170 [Propionibacteriaceae bacterium]|nr:hypothetical protein [Propionibacteriaceae bacterium]
MRDDVQSGRDEGRLLALTEVWRNQDLIRLDTLRADRDLGAPRHRCGTEAVDSDEHVLVAGSDELTLDFNSEPCVLATKQPPRSRSDNTLVRQKAVALVISLFKLREWLISPGPALEAHLLARVEQTAWRDGARTAVHLGT